MTGAVKIPLINKRMKRGSKAALGSKLRSMQQELDLLENLLPDHGQHEASISKVINMLKDQLQQSLDLLEGESLFSLKSNLVQQIRARQK